MDSLASKLKTPLYAACRIDNNSLSSRGKAPLLASLTGAAAQYHLHNPSLSVSALYPGMKR
jgi:hypothetical protein